MGCFLGLSGICGLGCLRASGVVFGFDWGLFVSVSLGEFWALKLVSWVWVWVVCVFFGRLIVAGRVV